MNQNFMQSKLPPVYRRSHQDFYLDPIRQKLIPVTPEETIRQHFIAWLIDELGVPKDMLFVEEPLAHYIKNLRGRADIIINAYDKSEDVIYAVAVIECKAPEIFLDDAAFKQMADYADKLNCSYCALTNGEKIFSYYFDEEENRYVALKTFPTYREMLQGEYFPALIDKPPSRIAFDELKKFYWDYVGDCIGEATPEYLQIPMTNFCECLLDVEYKFPARQYKIFRLVEDYGIRNLSVGNSSGGHFDGPYRSFIVEYNGDTKFVSIAVSSYVRWSNLSNVLTAINVAVDRGEKSHNSLELVVDDNVEVVGNEVKIFHNWSMTNGNKGAVKREVVKAFVSERYPQIRHADKCFLGTLTHDRLWRLDDPEVIPVIENFISYALLRDDLRKLSNSMR